jgi:calcium-dependent protein kinase
MGCCEVREEKTTKTGESLADISTDRSTTNPSTRPVGARKFVRSKGTLTSRYTLENQIDVSPVSVVYSAVHKKSGIKRAINSLPKSKMLDADQMHRYLDRLRSIDNPHIVRVIEVVEDAKYVHLVTEKYSGGKLLNRIQACHSFTETKAAKYLHQIITALSYCHELGVVHRDIRSENICFAEHKDDDSLKIIGFGFSSMMKALAPRAGKTRSKYRRRVITTQPYYTAPEALYNQYSEKSDIWSAGVILYVMLGNQ